jgi:hypothetical protein
MHRHWAEGPLRNDRLIDASQCGPRGLGLSERVGARRLYEDLVERRTVGGRERRQGDQIMPLNIRSGRLKLTETGAVLRLDDRRTPRTVVITRQALRAIASPPRADLSRVGDTIRVFRDIASEKYDKGQFNGDLRIWVTAKDVAKWKCDHPVSSPIPVVAD